VILATFSLVEGEPGAAGAAVVADGGAKTKTT
jgi:hypothetical protein